MDNILYVGFKGGNNSSYQLVRCLPGEKCLLTNSVSGLERDIDAIEGSFDVIYMFGLDKNLKDIVKIEICAEFENDVIRTGVDISELMKKLDAQGVKYVLSASPTKYLCNAAYYHMFRKMGDQVLFIHIPSQKYFSEDLKYRLMCVFKSGKETSLS